MKLSIECRNLKAGKMDGWIDGWISEKIDRQIDIGNICI